MAITEFDKLLGEGTSFLDAVISVADYTGVSSSAFFKCKYKGESFIVKMSPFIKQQPELYSDKQTNTTNTVETEIELLNILRKEFIQGGITPCIIEMVYCVIRPIPEPIKLPDNKEDHPKYARFNRAIEEYNFYADNGLSDRKIAISVLEQCDMTIDSFFSANPVMPIERAIRTAMLFMIIHCLSAITNKYPNFRHSDLHLNNILLRADPLYAERIGIPGGYLLFGSPSATVGSPSANGKDHSSATVGSSSTKFRVPYYGMFPKIIDFSYASLPEKKIISVITRDKYVSAFRRDSDVVFMLQNIVRHDQHYAPLLEDARKTNDTTELLSHEIFSAFSTPNMKGTKIKSYNI